MKFRKDLTGNRYGSWTVLEFDQERSDKTKRAYWKCQCDCGTKQSVLGQNLTSGHSKSCGCQSRNLKKTDLKGKIFGYLTVLQDTGKSTPGRNVIWECKCKCGNIVEVPGNSLVDGTTKSCGCYAKENSSYNLLGERFGKLVVIEKTEERKNGYVVWKCQCDCGNICYKNTYLLTQGKAISCGCANSKGEALIKNILDQNNIYYIAQYTFPNLKSKKGGYLRFDFAIFNKDGSLSHLIEYNGQQHYEYSDQWWNTKENFDTLQNNDIIKIKYCKENNIKLIIIPYFEQINLAKLLGEENEEN